MKNNDFKRINDVIQADKSVMSDGCKALVLQDFADGACLQKRHLHRQP